MQISQKQRNRDRNMETVRNMETQCQKHGNMDPNLETQLEI